MGRRFPDTGVEAVVFSASEKRIWTEIILDWLTCQRGSPLTPVDPGSVLTGPALAAACFGIGQALVTIGE